MTRNRNEILYLGSFLIYIVLSLVSNIHHVQQFNLTNFLQFITLKKQKYIPNLISKHRPWKNSLYIISLPNFTPTTQSMRFKTHSSRPILFPTTIILISIQDVNFSRHDTIAIISMSGKGDKFERITHDNILNQREMPLFEGKTFLSFKSWNVYAEISNLLATTIMGATRIVTRDRFNCKLAQDIIDEYNVQVLQLTAYQIQQMRPASVTGNYFETLERILCTGPRINETLINFSAICFPNSTLVPHLLGGSGISPPTTPVGHVEDMIMDMGKRGKANKGFLKGLFRKKQKANGIQ